MKDDLETLEKLRLDFMDEISTYVEQIQKEIQSKAEIVVERIKNSSVPDYIKDAMYKNILDQLEGLMK